VDYEVSAATEDHQADGRNQEKAANDHPEHAEGLEMMLQARLGDGPHGIAYAAAAIGAGDGSDKQLSSAAAAEHGTLRETTLFGTQDTG
jgi:hypothetical protein